MSTRTLAQAARYVTVFLGGFIAGDRIVSAAQAWKQWRTWAGRDPLEADVYRTEFLVDTAIVALAITIAVLIWGLLRPRRAEELS